MKILTAILILCILNFMAFAVESQLIGGSAANGRTENGHFFVNEHGRETEVSKRVWDYSLWHSRSLILSHPLAMVLALILGANLEEKRKQKIESDSNQG